VSARLRWALSAALVAFAANEPLAAAAQAREAQAVPVVHIEVDGERAAVSRTRMVASELLTRLGVASIVTATEDGARKERGAALAVAYFDLRDPLTPRLVVVEGGTGRELVRRSLPESSSLEISVEELSHVLYAVVEAVLQEPPREPPAPSQPLAEPAPAPVASPPPREPAPKKTPRSGADFDAGAFFRVVELGSSRMVPGGGLSLGVRSAHDGAAPGALLTAAVHGSTQVTHETASADLRLFSLRLYPTLTVPTGSAVSVVSGVGAGLDWFRIEQSRLSAEALPGVSSVLDVTLGALLGARIRASSSVTLDAAFSLDLDLTPHRFVADDGMQRSTLFELGRLRPGASLGASYSLTSEVGSGNPGANP
jgi:hypothetical protein